MTRLRLIYPDTLIYPWTLIYPGGIYDGDPYARNVAFEIPLTSTVPVIDDKPRTEASIPSRTTAVI